LGIIIYLRINLALVRVTFDNGWASPNPGLTNVYKYQIGKTH